MSSTADGGDALTAREQRRLEREERKRRRAAQESSKQSSASTEKKTPGKDDKRTKRDFSSSNGSVSKKPPSGTERTGLTSYEKVNIIEKTAKFDSVEKENKGKPKTEAPSKSDPSSRRKLGSKFFDNLSKFESQAKQNEDSKKFVRSYSTRPSHPSSTTSSTADPSFRRSYRPSRSTPVVDDPSVLTRRSLRKERVLESIAKLERKSSVDDGTTLRQKPSSPLLEKPEDKSKSSSRRSSASSTKTSHSDSGSSTTSLTKGLTRAQQALERHKERMRKTPAKPASPPGKIRSNESRKTPGKTPNSRSKEKESPPTTPSAEEPPTRKISVTTTPVEGDIVEVTTVTEVMTPAEGKMNVIVKEIAFSEEESEKLVSPVDSVEYQLGDPRPISVEDTVTKFTEPETPIEPVKTPTEEKPKRSRRKLPSIPSQEQDVIVIETSPTLAPAEEPIAETKPRHTSTNKTEPEGGSGEPILTPGKQDVAREMAPASLPAAESASEAKPRRRSKKKNRSEDGSGEPALTVETHNVVVVETSPTFTPPEEATSEKKTRRHSKKNRPGVGSKEPIFKEENQDAVKKTSPIFGPVEVPHTEKKTQHHYSKKNKPEDGSTEPVLTLEEQSVVVIETSSTFQENMDIPRSANAHSPPSDQNFQFTYNFNENSNLEQKSSMRDQMAFIRDQDLDNEQEAVKRGMDLIKHDKMIDDITVKKVTVPEMTTNKEMSGSKTYNPDEAIEVLRRLSQEVHSQPPVTERSSVTKSSIVTSQAIEEKNSQDQSKPKSDSTSQRRRDFSEKRPASLHIEEVLYISEEDDHPRSLSPQKRTFEEITRTPSPIKFRKSSIETFSRKSPTPEAPRTPSPQKSPAKLTPKSAADPPETLIFEYTAEVTPLVQRSRTPSPLKSPRSLPKTPDSPTKSPVRAPTPKSPPAKSPAPVSFPTKVPTSIPSPRSQSPVRSPQKVQESFQIVTDSAIKSADSTPKNRTPSPQREVAKSPTRVRTPSPVKRIESPSKEPEPKITSPPKSPEPQVRSSSPRLQKSREAPARSLSPVRTAATEKKSSKKKMLATRRNFAPRYKKSWLDESDDDNISLLSDAPSDASSIDMDWLGHDSSDDEDYVRKKSSLDKPSSVSVQRSSSSAQDMLKMWEKKVTQPDRGARSSPTKLPSDSVKRVGSVRAAWDSKRNSALQDSSYESISDAQERSNGHSENGSESPTTPSHGRLGSKLSPEDCGSLKSPSGSDWKSKASEEEKEIFDDKMAGKIQGAKALFENLTSSPKKSPSLVRSPRRKIIDKPPQQESAENSPELSRRSSTTDNIVTSRKSSISLASESSDAVMQNESSEDSLKVDNMRAMFESQANKKTEARRHKTSLAEMVADDDSDITDVRSIKAMWESMDNHR